MIIRQTDEALILITQPDHAVLAADLVQHWVADGFPASPNRRLILLAIEEHDNGWREVDAAPILDAATGRLLDFIAAPAETRQGVWPRGVERLAHSPYAAALVAQHALHIYRRYRHDAIWSGFFSAMEAARDRHLGAASPPRTLEDLQSDYFFLRAGDLASLTFCNGWNDIRNDFQAEESGYAIRFDGRRLTISPDPFGGREIPFEIAARELPARAFRSASEARDIFQAAPTIILRGVASGPTP
jgi:hypothetical protein